MAELRKDPVIGRWVIVASSRSKRPSDFFITKIDPVERKGCPFCEGNEDKTPHEIRAIRTDGSQANTKGWDVRVVPNKFPALGVEGDLDKEGVGMFDRMNGIGAHEVIIETPDHTKNIKDHTIDSWSKVLEVYKERYNDLKNDMRFKYILIFRNEGERAGASLEHPHSQLIATPVTPKRVKEELEGAMTYYQYKDRCVFCDIIKEEQRQKERLVYENEWFIAFCPFASRFPFEIWILPKEHQVDYEKISTEKIKYLADVMIHVQKKLAIALNTPHYNYIIHTAPIRWPRRGYWSTIEHDYHWHIEIMPALVRTAGFEWGSGFYINPTPPEEAAAFLRNI